jgi:protein SCO1
VKLREVITWFALRAALPVLLLITPTAGAQPSVDGPAGQFAYDQRLNVPIPSDLAFRDEADRDVTLGDYFGRRPIVLVLAQYRCPMLCNQVLNGLNEALRGLPEKAGDDYDVLVVSFDAREKSELAAAKKASYVEDYGRPGADTGFHFLTGEQPSIDLLTDMVGFRYAYSKPQDRFAHPTGIVVLTPSGKISKYFYGIDFPPTKLGQAIRDAGAERIGRPVSTYERVLLLCYDIDPRSGAYTLNVLNAVRVGGLLTIAVLAMCLAPTWVQWLPGCRNMPRLWIRFAALAVFAVFSAGLWAVLKAGP